MSTSPTHCITREPFFASLEKLSSLVDILSVALFMGYCWAFYMYLAGPLLVFDEPMTRLVDQCAYYMLAIELVFLTFLSYAYIAVPLLSNIYRCFKYLFSFLARRL
jgi:hypothetical protein